MSNADQAYLYTNLNWGIRVIIQAPSYLEYAPDNLLSSLHLIQKSSDVAIISTGTYR